MPIDYSKWDKIELSDDSDIEVHPNVDKTSFIKWKQRDIHEKRQQRNVEIKSILVQLTMYVKLNERVDYALKELPQNKLLDTAEVVRCLDAKFDKEERFDYEKLIEQKGDTLRKGLKDLNFDAEELANTPPYNEMIEDLFIQVRQDHPDASDPDKLVNYLKEHRAKIDDVLSRQTIKLDDLLYQKSTLIGSDDIHDGFNKSFLNKDAPEKVPAKETSKKVTTIETLNSPVKNEVATKAVPAKEEDDNLTLLPETVAFSKISDVRESAVYLMQHTHICTEQQKDALLMTAFDYQLDNDPVTAKKIIHQSLLLQYIAQLAGPNANKDMVIKSVKMFCAKITDESSPARIGFLQDVDNTANHIKTRCEFIRKEQEENTEEEATIQLKSLDDSMELLVNIPEEGTPEYGIFSTKLSPELQKAVKTGSLDEVNTVLATLKIEDAEQVLEVFNECGVIGINGYLEDENEFKELQQQYQENLNEDGEYEEGDVEEEEEEDAEEEEEEPIHNTLDEVD